MGCKVVVDTLSLVCCTAICTRYGFDHLKVEVNSWLLCCIVCCELMSCLQQLSSALAHWLLQNVSSVNLHPAQLV